MKLAFALRHTRYSHLIFCIIKISSILVAAQEGCVRNCTKTSGINQCIGSIPHDDTDWNALNTSVKSCYCTAVGNFSQCTPNCSTDGFSKELQGRLLGEWRYVNQVCGDVVDQFNTTATLSNNTATPTTASTLPTVSSKTGSLDSVSAPAQTESSNSTSSHSTGSSSKIRTIAISASLSNFGVLSIGTGLWLWFRKRKRRAEQSKQGSGDQQSVMDVIGPDGFPMDQSGPNLVSPMRGDPKSDSIKKWIQDQEKMKQLGAKLEPDAVTETLSVGYTLWSETDLCFTEIGAEDSRDMETITEEPDRENDIQRVFKTAQTHSL